jgi:hypothetical protein
MPLMIGGAILGGSLLSGLGGKKAAEAGATGQRDAAAITQQTTREQMALQTRMWEQGREDVAPYKEAGERGLGLYELAAYSPFEFNLEQDPIYKTQLAEQTKALERSGAAKGGLLSGGTLRDLRNATASELTSAYQRQYGARQDEINRFGALAGIGQGASQTLGSLGSQFSSTMGQIGMAGGQVQAQAASNIGQINAAGTQGMYGSVGQGLSSLGMMYGMGGFSGGGYNTDYSIPMTSYDL